MPVGALLSALTLPNFCAIQILGSISQTASHQSRWADRCESTNRLNKYAKHFGFTLASASTVTIELVSSTDPYLFLMSGQGTSGTELAKNDDSGDAELGLQNSRITYAASAGTYTAEATTFGSGATGDFTITVSVASPTNAPPEFGSATYSFSVDEDEANGHTVGTVAATDSDGTVASYSLDDTSLFSISNTGVITVTATDDDGGTGTATVAITVDDVLPSEPRNVVLTPGHAQINVAWTEPDSNGGASIDGYRVRHRATTATAWRYSIIIAASPYTITSLSNGTAYNVEVQARNSLQPPEFGHWSDVETATPVASTLPAVAAPATPTKTAANSSSITVSWAAVTGAAKYRVRYKTGTDDWGEPVDVAAATQYNAVMLDASTTYRFEVSAYGDGTTRRPAWGAWSTELEASTSAAAAVNGCITSLGAISGTSTLQGAWTDECVSSNRRLGTKYARYFSFQLEAVADLTIELVSDEDPYLILMEGAGTSGTVRARNDDSGDDGLGHFNSRITYEAAAGTYTAEATPYRSATTGDFTITIKAVTAPGAPGNVRLARGDQQVVVTWDPPENDGGAPITGYRVRYRSETADEDNGPGRSRRDVVDPNTLWNFRPWQEPAASGNRTEIASTFEEATAFLFEIQARNAEVADTDRFGAWSQRRTNQRPAFALSPYRINVSEDAEQNGSVGVVSATDPEGDSVSYALAGTDIFQINQTTGQITAAIALSGRGGTTYTMTATASDGFNLPVGVEVLITVELGTPPAVTPPTVSFASDGVTVDTEFTLPRDGFRYRLVLYKHLTSTTREVVSDHSPDFGDDAYAFFIGDAPDSTEEYFVGLRACRAGTTDTTGCETEQISTRHSSMSVASVTVEGLDADAIAVGSSTTFNVRVANLAPSQAYRLTVESTDNANASLQICTETAGARGIDIARGRLGFSWELISAYACGNGTAQIQARLKVGGVEIAQSSLEPIITDLPPVPTGVRANGDSEAVALQISVKWEDVGEQYTYELRYGDECVPNPLTGDIIPALCDSTDTQWVSPLSTGDNHLTRSRSDDRYIDSAGLYQIQVRSVWSNIKSEWSKPVYARVTNNIPSISVAAMPFYGHQADNDYFYRLCTNTFPSGVDSAVWADEITNALQQ